MKQMKLIIEVIPHLMYFKQPAGTSRGIYTTRKIWFVVISDTKRPVQFTNLQGVNFLSQLHQLMQTKVEELPPFGIGECAPLPQLSCDDITDYEIVLRHFCRLVATTGEIDYLALRPYPSMLFGLETALLHYQQSCQRERADLWLPLWENPFTLSRSSITINGLIWMGSFTQMYQRIEEKIEAGFGCIKLKIGALNFTQELELLQRIRNHYAAPSSHNHNKQSTIELRVDANGAFSSSNVLDILAQLATLDLHSIEQPIAARNWKEMARLCQQSPIDIALDEELIGINQLHEKERLLDTIHPHYIILKPSLHGGIAGANEWIELAKERGIAYWITSALESNVGLNAIAQWCGTHDHQLPQGLGTGQLFVHNIDSPLTLKGDQLWLER